MHALGCPDFGQIDRLAEGLDPMAVDGKRGEGNGAAGAAAIYGS
ncbi:hypothetical protein [uncultured Hoeflea sp.]|nr:hypothetical protein [uncultured Hoeflea sp.]